MTTPPSIRRETMQAPPPAPIDIEQKYKAAKAQLEKCFVIFHELLGDKVLDENKSKATKSHEHNIVSELTKAAVALDKLNVGEGLVAMAVIALREHLKVRDRVNELEYELNKATREIENLKKSSK